MAAPTNYYVDPQNGNDTTGDGSIGTPWQTVQHALDTITRDGSDGDQINIRDTADDVLSAALSFTTYGTPSDGAPVIFRGYTSAANDGGVGGLSGGGSVAIVTSTGLDSIHFIDMHLHNTGSNTIVQIDNGCLFARCEFDNSTGDGIDGDLGNVVIDCYFHNIGGDGVDIQGNGVFFCTFENETNDFVRAILISGSSSCIVLGNIVKVDGASDGIEYDDQTMIVNNTVWSDGGTGAGIDGPGTASPRCVIINNIVEGFSGTGGLGIHPNQDTMVYGKNALRNNTTNEDLGNDFFFALGDNDILGASPFTDPSNGDFSVDTSVKADAFPSTFRGIATDQFLDKGAAQREEPAGGGGVGPSVLRAVGASVQPVF